MEVKRRLDRLENGLKEVLEQLDANDAELVAIQAGLVVDRTRTALTRTTLQHYEEKARMAKAHEEIIEAARAAARSKNTWLTETPGLPTVLHLIRHK
ncbi:hypothetical protein A1O3_04515 [Capronia epimyces CBS 606.96]|uniref:Uncharacterized protein n=1 Tax=Capronia epimyces CBS 606.96 TaxID=1182542 RepID=W9YD13_9EURO|nr:uncharacterized protein A1O3_04515 [Capronia epimyces CBS 606.96]EXJ87555.1 hypothetical protein A1O3_04515 [Capronia epimyces CBS 606.96]